MKTLILAVAAVTVLGGCIAVPVHDSGPGGYYGPSVGIHVAPPPVVFYGHSYRGSHYRGRTGHRHYR
ncbi:MAG TPA: hypothetical protein VFO57_02330 [Burkholderiales bacterium]|nr:hypothetical protein [Burkholderiales bacterium]